MTISVAQFRTDYPEFVSSVTFPTPQIQYWLNIAYSMLNPCRWRSQLDMAAELYAAHNIVLEAKAMASAAAGGVPGTDVGVVSNKSVDKVSVGLDIGSVTEKDGGHWNSTIYGTRLYRLIKLFGAGPVQLGIGIPPVNSGVAWSGPDVTPGSTTFGG